MQGEIYSNVLCLPAATILRAITCVRSYLRSREIHRGRKATAGFFPYVALELNSSSAGWLQFPISSPNINDSINILRKKAAARDEPLREKEFAPVILHRILFFKHKAIPGCIRA